MVENLQIENSCPITSLKIVRFSEPMQRAISHFVGFNGANYLVQGSASFVEFLNKNPQVKEVVIGCLFNYPINRRIWLTQIETSGMINWKDWLAGLEYPKSDLEKIDFALEKIQKLIGRMGKSVEFDRNDPWFKMFFCQDLEEFQFVLKTLHSLGLIDLKEKPLGSDGEPIKSGRIYPWTVTITYKGMATLNEKRKEVQRDLCFIAMSFGESEKAIFTEAIELAVKACGYQARKVDDPQNHIDKEQTINDSILALAKKAHFVVCDYTGNKRGVYFEHGYAWGMGKKVIMTCKDPEVQLEEWVGKGNPKESFEPLHFDVRNYPFIMWKTLPELKQRLQDKIESWIGRYE